MGGLLEKPSGEKWGKTFGDSIDPIEGICEVSALCHFFPTNYIFSPSTTGLLAGLQNVIKLSMWLFHIFDFYV